MCMYLYHIRYFSSEDGIVWEEETTSVRAPSDEVAIAKIEEDHRYVKEIEIVGRKNLNHLV